MSFDLYWRRVPKPVKGKYVDRRAKYAIAPRLWHHDGTLKSEPAELSECDLSWLELERDRPGVEAICKAIRKYGKIEVWIA